MPAPSGAAYLLGAQIFAPVPRPVGIGTIGAAHPLPAVAGHIERAVGTRSVGQVADRAEIIPTGSEVGSRPIRRFIPPGIAAPVRSACRFFPLRFRRQAFTEPGTVRERAAPGRLHHGMILMAGMRPPFTVAPVNARVAVVDVEVIFAARAARADSIEKKRERAVGDLGSIDEKLGKLDFVLRPFVLRAVIAAHQKKTGGNTHHTAKILRIRRGALRHRDKTRDQRTEGTNESDQTAFHGLESIPLILLNEARLRKQACSFSDPVRKYRFMIEPLTFQRRGIVEGFFGPPWSMAQRGALFEIGAARGMNSYLYAPKDDPYHRKFWRNPYPGDAWKQLRRLIRRAQDHRIDFIYGFHPGEGLCFSDDQPIRLLLDKARRFYDAGVRTFAVLFDDIPSRLTHARDRRAYDNSLARAQGSWLARIRAADCALGKNVEWWICPSYYSEDPLLERVFGSFESNFLETLACHLPADVACFWTGPAVVCKRISLAHVRRIAGTLQHPLLLWDNYPVNDLSMSDELHLGPLEGRHPLLAKSVYGYLNNPLLQPELSLIPLATCFDYAAAPESYRPESSWQRVVKERFGSETLPHWRTLRRFCDAQAAAKKSRRPIRLTPVDRTRLVAALAYVHAQRRQRWAREFAPWIQAICQILRG